MITESFIEHTYRLYLHEPPQSSLQILGSELLRKNKLNTLLQLLADKKSSPSAIITASLFAKYYSYLLISGPLYMLSHLNKSLNLSIKHTCISVNENFSLSLYIDEESASTFVDQDNPWKSSMIHSIYYRNLALLFDELVRLTQIKPQTLWSHASFSTLWCYDQWIEAADEQMKQSLLADLDLIFREIPYLSTTKVIDHPLFPEKTYRLRRDCCLNHCLPNGNYCTTCPSITEEIRAERLIEYIAKKPNR